MLLGGIVILAAHLRFVLLGSQSIWLDEAASIALARTDWVEFWQLVSSREGNMVFFNTVLRYWMLLGDSEVLLRSLSAVFSIATVPVLAALGSRLFNARVGLVGALLLSLNGYHVRYAQEARSYSLLVLLITLSSVFFLKSLERPSRANWAAYIATGVLAVYSHLFGALVLLSHWVSILVVRKRDVPWKGLVVSSALIGVLVLPLVVLVGTSEVGELGDWIPRPGISHVYRVFYGLSGSVVDDVPWAHLLLGVYLVSALAGVLLAVRRGSAAPSISGAWQIGFLASWLLVPLGVGLIVSVVRPIFVPRFFIVSLPPLVLLAAAGISRIRPQPMLRVALLLVVVLAARGVIRYHRDFQQEDWRAATRYVLAEAQPGDGLIFYIPLGRLPFDYYARDAGSVPTVLYPSSPWILEERPGTLPTGVLSGPRRVWFIPHHARLTKERQAIVDGIQAALSGVYPVVSVKRFPGMEVILYRR